MTAAGDEVRTSHRELSALLVKSARGLGFTVGNAEDLARAAAWLSLRSHDGVAALLALPHDQQPPSLVLDGASEEVAADGVAVGWHGPGLVDLVVSGVGSTMLRLGRVDAPGLLLALCAVAARDHQLRFAVTSIDSGGQQQFDIDGFDCRPSPSGLAADGAELRISCQAADAASPTWPTQEIAVPAEQWAAANRLAARTYVPGDERSRQVGAGAGLTDND